MTRSPDDRLDWLRRLRKKIAARCGNDLHATNETYRAAAARVPHRAYRGETQSRRTKAKAIARG